MPSRWPRISLLVLVAAGVLVMAACDDDDPVAPPTTETATSSLVSLNGETATGTVTFSLTADEFIARVELEGADPDMPHAQHVHASAACPTAAADTNSDGFIDILEGMPSYGGILVPLDGDISAQAAGSATFPSADANGEYIYADTASFTAFMTDLLATDPDPTDAIVKLPTNSLNIGARTVVVLGVADTTTLPTTVATLPGLTAQQSLPIACGTIN